MLVLTRKLQEQISIGQDVTITILRVKGNTVRIGIDAPQEVRVVRGELPRHETPRTEPHGYRPPTEFEVTHETVPQQTVPQQAVIQQAVPQQTAARKRSRTPGLKSIVDRLGQRDRAADSVLLSVAALVD